MTQHTLSDRKNEKQKRISEALTEFLDGLIWILYRDLDEQIMKEAKLTRDELRANAFSIFIAHGSQMADFMIKKGSMKKEVKQEFIKIWDLSSTETSNPEYKEEVDLLTTQTIDLLTILGDKTEEFVEEIQ